MAIGIGISPVFGNKAPFAFLPAEAPSGLTATTFNDIRIDLACTSNSAGKEDGFYWERSPDGITSWAVIGTTLTGVVAYSDTTCAAGILYYYRCRAYRGTVYSDYSNVDSDTTFGIGFGDELFYLDGEIIDSGGSKYFKDQTTNGRDFLITGYDFNSDWDEGFPYKSTATISAPAADAALIAADINNFLYDIGGTPNAIPVVSIYQDVEYVNRFFSKHSAQVVDGNGVETYEPRVLEFVGYTNVKAGADLTACQIYFGVPVEATSNVKWVDGINGDNLAAGTKAAPYKTITKAISVIGAGHTIYVKSGICTEGSGGAGYNILLQKAATITATGFTQVRGGGDTANALLRIDVVTVTDTINNFIFDGTGGYDAGILMSQTNKIINRCLIRNIDVDAVTISGGSTLNYCIVTERRINCLAGISTINTCYLYTANTIGLSTANATVDLQLTNNKLSTRLGNTTWIYYALGANFAIKGNTFNIDHDCTPCYVPTPTTATFTFTYNKYNISAQLTKEVIKQDTTGNTWVVENNEFNITNTLMANAVILFPNPTSISVQNNKIISLSTNQASAIAAYSTGTTCNLTVIKKNQIEMRNVGSYVIRIGGETTGAGNNKMTNIDISENYLKSAAYFNNAILATMTSHGIFVGFNIDAVIKYNRVEGAGYGILCKNSAASDVSGMIMYNLVINCLQGIRIKGLKDSKIYGNTVVNNTAIEASGLIISNNAGADECEDFIVKNNICYSPLVRMLFNIEDTDGGAIDYNTYNALALQFTIVGTLYASLATYIAGETLDVNSIDTDPALTDYIPDTPLDCETLAATYDDGLDVTTDFGDSDTLPVIVTKQQGATWQKGAFVQ